MRASKAIWDAEATDAEATDAEATDAEATDAEATVEALAADSQPARHRAVDLVPRGLCAEAVLLADRIDDQERPSLRSAVWLRSADGERLLVSIWPPPGLVIVIGR